MPNGRILNKGKYILKSRNVLNIQKNYEIH